MPNVDPRDVALSRRMLRIADRWAELLDQLVCRDSKFGHVALSRERLLQTAERVGDRAAYIHFWNEYRKERFAALRAPFKLDASGEIPAHSAYRSEWIDAMRMKARANNWHGVVDATTRAVAQAVPTRSEHELALAAVAERERIATEYFSLVTDSSVTRRNESELRRALIAMIDEQLAEHGFSVKSSNARITSFTRHCSDDGMFLSLVDLSFASIGSGVAEFAVAIHDQATLPSSSAWQFHCRAYYSRNDLAPWLSQASAFSPTSPASLRLAAYCICTLVVCFADLVQSERT